MINVSEIRSNLFGVVGLRQPYDPEYDILESTLTASSSGMFFEQYSSYVNVRNIYDSQPYADISETNFNIWLTNAIKDSISKVIQRCFSKNDLIENALLYSYSTRKTSAYELANGQDFVGYEITVSKRKDLSVFINKIFTEFSGTGTVKILLFNDNKESTIQTQEVIVTDKSAKETVLNWALPYANSVTGGKYYIGYLTDGLVPKAINRDYESAAVRHCYNALKIQPIKVANWTDETLFDIEAVEYTSETWGLNFDISSFRDYTSYIVNNKNMFVEVIGYQFAADMLGMMITSNRTNATERLQKGNLLLELQGNYTNEELPTFKGVNSKLESSVKEVQKKLVDDPKMIILQS